jgi:hypothetical protein
MKAREHARARVGRRVGFMIRATSDKVAIHKYQNRFGLKSSLPPFKKEEFDKPASPSPPFLKGD